MNSVQDKINASIANLEETVREIRAKQKLLRTHRVAIAAKVRTLMLAIPGFENAYDPWINTEHDYDMGTSVQVIRISMTLNDLPALRGYVPLDALLMAFVDAPQIKTKDYASSLNRDYYFIYPQEDGTLIKVAICCYVRSDSVTCTKVLVGSKTRTVVDEEYKLVCGEPT